MEFHYEICGEDFDSAGAASSDIKRKLRQLGLPSDVIRRTAIAMYEAEINMVIHAGGGVTDVIIGQDSITIILKDSGPGIADIDQAMQEGYSTATEQIRNLGFGAGMGLPNILKNSDKLDIKSTVGEGTTVTIRLNLQEV